MFWFTVLVFIPGRSVPVGAGTGKRTCADAASGFLDIGCGGSCSGDYSCDSFGYLCGAFVIIVTGIYGGLTAGTNIAALAGLDAMTWSGIGIVIGAVIAMIGIIVQFMMHSKEGREERAELLEKGERAGFYGV